MAKEDNFSYKEYLIIGGAVAASIVVSSSPKWEHGVEFTVALFAVLIMALRPVWREPLFWRGLAVVLLLHVIVVFLVTQALPPDSLGIRGIPAILMGVAEGLFIANILWRATHRNSSGTPDSQS